MGRSERIRLRQKLLKLGPYCYWCGKEFPSFIPKRIGTKITKKERKEQLITMPTLEHLIPKKDFEQNIRLACFGCNK